MLPTGTEARALGLSHLLLSPDTLLMYTIKVSCSNQSEERPLPAPQSYRHLQFSELHTNVCGAGPGSSCWLEICKSGVCSQQVQKECHKDMQPALEASSGTLEALLIPQLRLTMGNRPLLVSGCKWWSKKPTAVGS